MKPNLVPVGMILLVLLSAISASALTIPSADRSHHESAVAGTNTTTVRYPVVRIDMPATSGLNVTNDGFVTETGFGFGVNWDLGIGILCLTNLTVTGGPLTVKPLSGNELVLNPGDSLSVLFGVFHYCVYQPPDSLPRGFLMGWFIGVTITQSR